MKPGAKASLPRARGWLWSFVVEHQRIIPIDSKRRVSPEVRCCIVVWFGNGLLDRVLASHRGIVSDVHIDKTWAGPGFYLEVAGDLEYVVAFEELEKQVGAAPACQVGNFQPHFGNLSGRIPMAFDERRHGKHI